LYDYSFPTNDLDILISDWNFDKKVKSLGKMDSPRFGGLKFEYENFSMDVFGLKNIFFLNKNPSLEKSLENVLEGCDISTSAIAYNLENRIFFGRRAMKDISSRKIDLLNDYLEVGPTIARLILHADKMNFSFGNNALNYLKRNYDEEVFAKVKDWLEYKEKFHLYPLIERNWREVIVSK